MPINVNKVIKGVEKILPRLIGEDIELSIHISDKDLTVMADGNQMEHVLMNLATNARDAMPEGGNLLISSDFTEIDKRFINMYGYGEPGRYAVITVSDTGEGIDEQTKEKIFEPFFTTKEVGKGTGLGLAMVYSIVKQHDGFINVYSEKGRGTSFTVYLPASKKSAFIEKDICEPVVQGSGTVLLVDDEQMILDVGGQMLEKLGYQVLTAPNGKEAIKRFERHKDHIVLVILDMIMPVMGGSETFDILKSMHPTLKVLLSSGYAVDGQASDILKRGCNGFIQKPFNLEQLSRKTSEALQTQ
jgi:CheY-like chemotaxis protein/two-component sensor histidine kinase